MLHVERAGTVEDISPESVSVGSIVIVKPGEKVPLDGVVVEGTSPLNTVPSRAKVCRATSASATKPPQVASTSLAFSA